MDVSRAHDQDVISVKISRAHDQDVISVKISRAHDQDVISVKIIKICADSIAHPVTFIFQTSLVPGIFSNR